MSQDIYLDKGMEGGARTGFDRQVINDAAEAVNRAIEAQYVLAALLRLANDLENEEAYLYSPEAAGELVEAMTRHIEGAFSPILNLVSLDKIQRRAS